MQLLADKNINYIKNDKVQKDRSLTQPEFSLSGTCNSRTLVNLSCGEMLSSIAHVHMLR